MKQFPIRLIRKILVQFLRLRDQISRSILPIPSPVLQDVVRKQAAKEEHTQREPGKEGFEAGLFRTSAYFPKLTRVARRGIYVRDTLASPSCRRTAAQ